MTPADSSGRHVYKRRVFGAEVIELCVRWYVSYRLSYRGLVEIMAERGIHVAHTTILRSRIFSLATLVGLIVMGLGMFSIIGYLPTYLQMVHGCNAAESGLVLVPMVIGVIATSMTSGQLISRNGRYRSYHPIVGSLVVIVATLLIQVPHSRTIMR